ncbi:hypothetical protein [Brachybacterium sp. J153]|nr:hypothetical protein [Brachybacterium sp. J153]MEE1618490.1 hypothetical protein [Brachybacterium sp. J153]
MDTLTTVFPFGSAPFVRLREQFWLDVFAVIAERLGLEQQVATEHYRSDG